VTAQSPVGRNPAEFGIKITGPVFEGFAQNDLTHEDPTGADHRKYTNGLNAALNSYLNREGFDRDVANWFDFQVVPPQHSKDLIEGYLSEEIQVN
ncbi:MAG: radical SAM protein, partial [Cyclobacteriaceae bacterium]